MGRGIDLARAAAPLHAAVLDDLKDQLLIVFLRRLIGEKTGQIEVPLAEIDDTSQALLSFKVDPTTKAFTFVLGKKQ